MRMSIYELFNDILQMEMQQEFNKMKVIKNKTIFSKYFLNMDISAAIAFSYSNLKCTFMRSICREACLKMLI